MHTAAVLQHASSQCQPPPAARPPQKTTQAWRSATTWPGMHTCAAEAAGGRLDPAQVASPLRCCGAAWLLCYAPALALETSQPSCVSYASSSASRPAPMRWSSGACASSCADKPWCFGYAQAPALRAKPPGPHRAPLESTALRCGFTGATCRPRLLPSLELPRFEPRHPHRHCLKSHCQVPPLTGIAW